MDPKPKKRGYTTFVSSNSTSDDGEPSVKRMNSYATAEASSGQHQTGMNPNPQKRGYTTFVSSNSTSDDGEPPAKGINSYASGEASSRSEITSSSQSDEEASDNEAVLYDRSVKRTQASSSSVPVGDGVAAKLMAQMGYQSGTGLGKHAQGRVQPVEASKQKGRRGLGMTPSNFAFDDTIEWIQEDVSCEEEINWIPIPTEPMPSLITLKEGMKVGPKRISIKSEDEFVDPQVLRNVLSCKTVFDELEDRELRKARTNSNPFELIRGVIFQNRAAMKMANVDAMFDFMFTEPKDRSGRSLIMPGEPLYFADICAGPGGFSEYVLWRKKWRSKGFGLTLKSGPGVNDFKLEEFFVSPSECFEPHYGVGGMSGDGDIYKQDNMEEFANFVWSNTEKRGVHFVMADGGFSVEGQENEQEILSKRLYLCQFLCTIMILREGGHFMCKLFDVFTPFSVGLIYLMRQAFDQVCIVKPVTSRPANSERYLVCKGFQVDPGLILKDYLTHVNLYFDKLKFGSSYGHVQCVQYLVPIDTLKDDEEFFDYIYNSNNELGHQQCMNLKKIQIFTKNSALKDDRQLDIRAQCLQLWKIPDEVRSSPGRQDPEDCVRRLLKGGSLENVHAKPTDWSTVEKEVKSVFDYRLITSGMINSNEPSKFCYVLSLGRSKVFKYLDGRWRRLSEGGELRVEMPRDTLLVCEIVAEYKSKLRRMALHIVDVLFLYGEDFREFSYNIRMENAALFEKAISRATDTRVTPVRVKQVHKLENLQQFFTSSLDFRRTKNFGQDPRLVYLLDSERPDESAWIVLSAVNLLPLMKKPWTMCYSTSKKANYFYNLQTKQSGYEAKRGMFSGTENTINHTLAVNMNEYKSPISLDSLNTQLTQWIRRIAKFLFE